MNSPKGHAPAVGLISNEISSKQKFDSQITRRGFCGSVLLSSAALMTGTDSLSAAASARENYQSYPPAKIEGAQALLPGSSLYFYFPKKTDPAVLIRSEEGEYYAFSQKCSHMGCSVTYDRARRCLECPCHRGTYDSRTGFVMFGPPKRALNPIFLEMRAGGEVWAVGKGIGGDERVLIAGRVSES
jgi:nitrite reductase/ring-hydroxylating ferredoxin subunit